MKKLDFLTAMEELSRDERFKATVYAINTLLIQKGVYSPEEFERYFAEWANNHRKVEAQGKEPQKP